jgi:HEAT repeat protein
MTGDLAILHLENGDSLSRSDDRFWQSMLTGLRTLVRAASPAIDDALVGSTTESAESATDLPTMRLMGAVQASENATAPVQAIADPGPQVQLVFHAAEEEDFDAGVESRFSRRLSFLLTRYGSAAIRPIEQMIASQRVSDQVKWEALRVLGQVDSPSTYDQRLRILQRRLLDPSRWVRDGAALGLSWMEDPAAIPALEKAIAQEPTHELRRNLTVLVQHLEERAGCR